MGNNDDANTNANMIAQARPYVTMSSLLHILQEFLILVFRIDV
jgi:hypothetical protein